MDTIYTIGHSNHPQEMFLSLLRANRIQIIVDVRSHPYSQWAVFANRENLERVLKAAGIDYLYMGASLGGHPEHPEFYDTETGRVNYETIRRSEPFKNGLRRLMSELKSRTLSIMCAEEDPDRCHRNRLVAESLRREGIKVFHIRGDGRVQSDEDLWKERSKAPGNQYSLPL